MPLRPFALAFALLLAGSTAIHAQDKRPADAADAWWAWQPLSRPSVPDEKSPWVRTPIDAFILSRLRGKGLEPSPEADRRTLIRRLTYNLHGLPPTPAEVAGFLTDPSVDAYEKLVDRLLASPRYGERWGRHWLDVVHFGESHGYDKDKPRLNAWPYRDYIIESLNADKPYSRFVEEQLAGDVLFPDDPRATVATGFIAAGPWDFVGHVELREGTLDKKITRSNDRDDMVATAMSTFQSLTVHCARCHDHKFDPISQNEYYRLQAVFAGIDRGDRSFDADRGTHLARRTLTTEQAALTQRQKSLDEILAKVTTPAITQFDARLKELNRQLAAIPAPAESKGTSPTNGYHSAIMPQADAAKWVQVDLGKSIPIERIRLIPARPTDFPDSPGFGFPRRFLVEISDDAKFNEKQTLADHTAADFANPGEAPFILSPADRTARFVRVTATRLWKRNDDYVFALAEMQVESGGKNVALGASVTALDSIEAGRWSMRFLVDDFSSRGRLEGTPPDPALAARRAALQTEIAKINGERTAALRAALNEATQAEFDTVARGLADVTRKLAGLPVPQKVYSITRSSPAAGGSPRPVYFLNRGSDNSPGKEMPPGALSCLPGLPAIFTLPDPNDEGSRRAALAKWITDPRNMLTQRSIANRVWQYHFGRGLVDTPNDFGHMGSHPTHPELLDWLAAEFQQTGESLKTLHRLILRSAAYRQASTHNAAHAAIDSGNQYLWRMNRHRLEAEAIRDAVLAVSGKLDLKMGGPSVQQFFFKDDHSPVYDYARFNVETPASFRRSVYRFIVRSVPDPFLECLDCADPSLLTPKRNTTLTALQALSLLNNQFMVRQSEHFSARLRTASNDPATEIETACQLAYGRPPRPEESRLLVDYAARHGLVNACRLILNSNEFLFVD